MEITKRYSRRRRNLSIDDRISDLPDSIICHILSFLSTKESVATSILGQRWRYLWSYVPSLIFHNENQDTVNRVLSLHKAQSIDTFILTDDRSWCDQSQIGAWINFAVDRNVRSIKIFRGMFSYVDLPPCLFTCKTLVDVRLKRCGALPVSVPVCLPRLEILHLIYSPLKDDESLPNLLSGCPVLEELVILLYDECNSCIISSPTIKWLTIEIHSELDEEYRNWLEIDVPTLVYLDLRDNSSHFIKCGELTSLIEADIYLDNDEIDDFSFFRSVVEFIDKLRNVECLNLHLSYCTETFESLLYARNISFHNLTKLELSTSCRVLWKFLENANHLEILIFPQARAMDGQWMVPQQVPTCLLSSLRIIKFVNFAGTENIFKGVRYLLRNAKVLKLMKIVYSSFINSDEKIDMLQKISSFQRGSSVCEVRFV